MNSVMHTQVLFQVPQKESRVAAGKQPGTRGLDRSKAQENELYIKESRVVAGKRPGTRGLYHLKL